MERISPYLKARLTNGVNRGVVEARAAVERLFYQKFGHKLKRGFFGEPKESPVNLDAALRQSEHTLSQEVEEKKGTLSGYNDPTVHARPGTERKPSAWHE